MKKKLKQWLPVWITCLILLSPFLLYIGSLGLTYLQAYQIAGSGQPIVKAIYQYNQDNGKFPSELDELNLGDTKIDNLEKWKLHNYEKGWVLSYFDDQTFYPGIKYTWDKSFSKEFQGWEGYLAREFPCKIHISDPRDEFAEKPRETN